MFKTNNNLLNPVQAWVMTVKLIWSTVKEFNDKIEICSYVSNKTLFLLTSNLIQAKLGAVVEVMGEATLGFHKDAIKLHFIRAGGAMAMFLSGVLEISIQ